MKIERPNFFEGQIVGAADLGAGVDHSRGQLARHERYLHIWGIAEGLELEGKPKQTARGNPFTEVTVKAGFAVDRAGREVVLADDTRLPAEDFEQSNRSVGQPDDAWFPVFLSGVDSLAPAPLLAAGMCGTSEPTRFQEDFRLDFGRPGDEFLEEDPPQISDGPVAIAGGKIRRILLGFVQWDKTLKEFHAVEATHKEVGRTYAGVRADVVAARGGSLALRTRSGVKAENPAVSLSEQDGGLLAFGPLTTSGAVRTPVFSVNAKGDLTITGRFVGAVTPGSVHVQSGVAMDGVIVPLPPGITQEMLDDGKAIAHVHVTPSIITTPSGSVFVPVECSVDAERRVHCQLRWFPIAGGVPAVDFVANCDYLVLVSVPAK